MDIVTKYKSTVFRNRAFRTNIFFVHTLYDSCAKSFLMKVGKNMDNCSIVKKVFQTSPYGIAKTAAFLEHGMTNSEVRRLCQQGIIKNVRHGFYQLVEGADATEEQLLATLLPEGILCVESALFQYGYIARPPKQWHVAVPRTVTRSKLQIPTLEINAYYVQAEQYELGKNNVRINDVTLSMYDRERTICDCYKYRHKLGSKILNKAMHAYVADEEKNLIALPKYAKKMRVYRGVMELMEVLL